MDSITIILLAVLVFFLVAALVYISVCHPALAKKGLEWLRADKKRAVITVAGLLLAYFVLGALIVIALVVLGIIALIAYDWWQSRQPAPAVLNWPMLVNSTYEALFLALQQRAESADLRRPVVVTELPHAPQIAEKRGIQVIQAKVLKKERGPMDDEAREKVKHVLQTQLNAMLDAGYLANIPVSVSPNFPPWVIDEIVEAGAYCVIHVVIPYNQAAVDYLTQRVFEMPAASPQPPADGDF